jgi:nitronate monooxygenase
MWSRTALTGRLDITYPLVQAPMASISTAPMAAAVSHAGALGSIGAATMTLETVKAEVEATRSRTSRPFAVNFFVHRPPRLDAEVAQRTLARLEGYRLALGADPFPELVPAPPFGAEQMELMLALRPPVVSFHFGLPEPEAVKALQAAGIRILSSATTVAEARLLEAGGVDAVIAQGMDAGGHRGTFASSFEEGEMGTMALVPQVVDAVTVPVIAAGGIADGRGIAAALALGAAGVQMGTAFLGCPEAVIDPVYRRILSEPRAARTRITTAWSGRPARTILTRFVEEMGSEPVLEFPLQRQLTGHLTRASRGDPELHAMWAGQAAPLLRNLQAADLVAALVTETEAALARAANPGRKAP